MTDDRIKVKTIYVTPGGREFSTREEAVESMRAQDVITKCGFTPGAVYTAAEAVSRILFYYDLKEKA